MFTPSQLRDLRRAYGAVQDVPPHSPAMDRLKATVRRMPREAQEQVAKANIRWLSAAAQAALKGKLDEPLPATGGHVRDQGRGYPMKEKKNA